FQSKSSSRGTGQEPVMAGPRKRVMRAMQYMHLGVVRPVSCGLFALLCGVAGPVHAKCGGDSRSLPELYAASDAVFVGTAVRVWVPYVPPSGKEQDVSAIQEMLVDFRVLRSWKGASESFMTLDNSSVADLGTPIEEGETYLVWADRRGPR